MSVKTFSVQQLADFVTQTYQTLGLTVTDAELIADTLVQADLWGHQSHGVITKIKNTPRVPDTEEIFYPGELEARAEQRQRATGISIPKDTVTELDNGAHTLGVPSLIPSLSSFAAEPTRE